MSDAKADETERRTRKRRIDPRLEARGWSVVTADNSGELAPEAITEYPTTSGPADYALSVDGRILGVVEAKRLTIGGATGSSRANRYPKGQPTPELEGIDDHEFG